MQKNMLFTVICVAAMSAALAFSQWAAASEEAHSGEGASQAEAVVPPPGLGPREAQKDEEGEAETVEESFPEGQPFPPFPSPAGAPPAAVYRPPGVQAFNPDMSVIGDFIGQFSSQEGGEPDDSFLFRELELGLTGYIDPFSRADVFLGVHKEEETEEGLEHYAVDLEEAFVTLLTLGKDLQAKVGKFLVNFGKVNTFHRHALPWEDFPPVTKNLLGEEGLAGEGVNLSWLVPNPRGRYMELAYEAFNADNHTLLGGEGPAHLLHFKGLHEFSPSATLEAGITGLAGKNEHRDGEGRTSATGLDLTYKWRPLQQALYKALLCQGELFLSKKELDAGSESSWGGFVGIERQNGRRTRLGARLDYSQFPENSSQREQGYSAFFTLMQSEFAFWCVTYSFIDRNFTTESGEDEHRLSLQLNFGLGPHRAHKY